MKQWWVCAYVCAHSVLSLSHRRQTFLYFLRCLSFSWRSGYNAAKHVIFGFWFKTCTPDNLPTPLNTDENSVGSARSLFAPLLNFFTDAECSFEVWLIFLFLLEVHFFTLLHKRTPCSTNVVPLNGPQSVGTHASACSGTAHKYAYKLMFNKKKVCKCYIAWKAQAMC